MSKAREKAIEVYTRTFGEPPWPIHIQFWDYIMDAPKGDIIEVGSWRGQAGLIMACAAWAKGVKYISVDPYPTNEVAELAYPVDNLSIIKQEFKRNVIDIFPEGHVTQYNCDILECKDLISKNRYCLAYIDGLHAYENCRREFDILYPLVLDYGWVILDDTAGNLDEGRIDGQDEGGVERLFREVYLTDKYFDKIEFNQYVAQAIGRKKKTNDLEFREEFRLNFLNRNEKMERERKEREQH